MAFLSVCYNFQLKFNFLKIACTYQNDNHLFIGVFNTKDNSLEFLGKIQLPASINCNITIYHTLWRYLTSIFLHNSTLTEATKSIKSQVRSSTFHSFDELLQLKSSREDLVLFFVTSKTYRLAVPGFCKRRLLRCSSKKESDIWHMISVTF